jgi:hypothetical protein
MTKKQVIELVEQRLRQVGHGLVFEVIADGVRKDGTWWHVPVIATRHGKDVPREVTVNIFANLEDELEQQHNLSVLFVPVVSEPSIT